MISRVYDPDYWLKRKGIPVGQRAHLNTLYSFSDPWINGIAHHSNNKTKGSDAIFEIIPILINK